MYSPLFIKLLNIVVENIWTSTHSIFDHSINNHVFINLLNSCIMLSIITGEIGDLKIPTSNIFSRISFSIFTLRAKKSTICCYQKWKFSKIEIQMQYNMYLFDLSRKSVLNGNHTSLGIRKRDINNVSGWLLYCTCAEYVPLSNTTTNKSKQ